MIEKEISNKFKVLSVLAILLVVIIHSNNVIPIENDNYTFATFNYNFQNLLTQGIARIAVPIFFIISGYYFFERINKNDFKTLAKKKIFTLVIPYIFWNFVVLSLYFFIDYSYLPKTNITNNITLLQYIKMITIQPINGPLWFIRDLLFLMILGPIINFVLKGKYIKEFMFILFFLWILNLGEGTGQKAEPLFFFSLGGFIAFSNKKYLFIGNNTLKFLIFILYFILLGIHTKYLNYYNYFEFVLLHKLIILLGIFTFWFLIDFLKTGKEKILLLSKYSFLIYVIHYALVYIIKEIMINLLGKYEYVNFISFIITTPIIILISILFFYILKKYSPNFMNLILGNRI